jgi:uncharacterized RDD family membrane protein YckC
MSIEQNSIDTTIWQQLCESFSSDPALWAEVRSALTTPQEYLAAFGDRLANRGIESADEVSPWIALVDWLDENDRLVELDWKSSSGDLVDYLSTLPPLATGVDLSPVAAENVAFGFAVQRANAILARSFRTLLFLDIDSDSYPLALVSAEAAPRIQQLAVAVGHVARPLDDRETADAVARGERGYGYGLPIPAPPRVGPAPVNFGKRLLALVIDAALLWGVAAGGVSLGIAINGSSRGGLIPAVLFTLLAVYLIGLAVLVGRTGQSLGMMTLGLKLVRVDSGAAPGFLAAVGRGLLCVLLIFWIWGLIMLLTTLSDPNGRGLHDKAAGTLLVDTRRPRTA